MIVKYDLHVSGLISTNGGCIYKNKGLVTDIRGRVPPKTIGNYSESMMIVDRGTYVVQFEEFRFSEFDMDNATYEVYQDSLFNSSMFLLINSTPFMGQLMIYSPSQIEVGAKIATIVFKIKEDTPVNKTTSRSKKND